MTLKHGWSVDMVAERSNAFDHGAEDVGFESNLVHIFLFRIVRLFLVQKSLTKTKIKSST